MILFRAFLHLGLTLMCLWSTFPVPIHLDCGEQFEPCRKCNTQVLHSGLQNRQLLQELLKGVTEARDRLPLSELTARRPKLMLKIAPDIDESQLVDMAEVIKGSGIDGVIVSNTTIQRPKSLTDRKFLLSFFHQFLTHL